MTCLIEVKCPDCHLSLVGKNGFCRKGNQRYPCHNQLCEITSFMLEYRYKAWYRGVRNNIVKMAINSSGIRDTSRVPGVSKTTVK
ncbi:IS1-like element transposase [Endozoicomonas sp.]|uniref:IS1-like element transposase n=1 Tax=Endozoicomonas sp. TaxID=1892382 RepID=UPI00383AF2BB